MFRVGPKEKHDHQCLCPHQWSRKLTQKARWYLFTNWTFLLTTHLRVITFSWWPLWSSAMWWQRSPFIPDISALFDLANQDLEVLRDSRRVVKLLALLHKLEPAYIAGDQMGPSLNPSVTEEEGVWLVTPNWSNTVRNQLLKVQCRGWMRSQLPSLSRPSRRVNCPHQNSLRRSRNIPWGGTIPITPEQFFPHSAQRCSLWAPEGNQNTSESDSKTAPRKSLIRCWRVSAGHGQIALELKHNNLSLFYLITLNDMHIPTAALSVSQ